MSENAALLCAAVAMMHRKNSMPKIEKEFVDVPQEAGAYMLTNATLYETCLDVEQGEDVFSLIQGMIEICRKHKGVGLAANQIGSLKRVIVINTAAYRQAIINPVITKRCCGTVRAEEGCLSFPNRKVMVTRDKQVTLEGFTHEWKPIKIKLRGLEARVAQHEIDHLNGKTIF